MNEVKVDDRSAQTKATAILAIIVSLSAVLVPVLGVLYLNPIAIILSCIAIYGGDFKSLGLVSAIIIVVNYIISPTFWLNIGTGAQFGGSNLFLTWFGVIGSLVMIVLIVRKYKN